MTFINWLTSRNVSLVAVAVLTGAVLLAPALPLHAQSSADAQAGVTASATRYVDVTTGADGSGCSSQASPCRTIQAAIDASQTDDTILVAGSANGSVYSFTGASACSDRVGTPVVACIADKRLTILGGYSTSNWSNANPSSNVTIIDGQGSSRGIYVLSANKPTTVGLHMEGFTIRNSLGRPNTARGGNDGAFGFGGGLGADYVGSLVLKHMVFASNTVIGIDRSNTYGGYGAGGAMSLRYVSSATLEDIAFTGNQAKAGSGSSRGGYALGGALYAHSSNVTGANLVFRDNSSIAGNTTGAGISDGQRADAFGAAGTFMHGSSVTLSNVVAENNKSIGGNASDDSGGAFGGAFKVEKAEFNLLDSTLRFNTAQGGNARNGWIANGGAIEGIDATITLNRVVMVGNHAVGGNGTTGYRGRRQWRAVNSARSDVKDVSAKLTLINCIVADNTSVNGSGATTQGGGGGGLYAYNSTITVDHTTIANNTVDSFGYGTAILFLQNSSVQGSPLLRATISNSIVSGHKAPNTSQPAIMVNNGGELRFEQGIYYDNSGGTIGNVYGLETTTNGAPAFRAPGSPKYNYHITNESAAINLGSDALKVDFENQPRTDGKPDFGADEYALPPTPPVYFNYTRVTKTSISIAWRIDAEVADQLARYRITHKYLSEGTAGIPVTDEIDVGTETSHRFTDLYAYSLHTITIDALNSDGKVVASSGAAGILTTDKMLHLPHVARP